MEISKRIKTDIQNSEALKDKIESLNLKNREIMKNNIQHERTINTLKVTLKSLEQRLAQAQTKIEELNAVKGENEAVNKKFATQKKHLETCIKEIEGYKKYQEEIQKKYEALEKKAAAAPAPIPEGESKNTHEATLGAFRKARASNQQSRQSRSSTFFQELAKTSMLPGRKPDSTMTPQNNSASRGGNMKSVNSLEVQRHLQVQEETYTDIIYKLQHDRMRLRGKDIA